MTRTRKTLIGALVLGLLSGPAIAVASAGFGDDSSTIEARGPETTVATVVTTSAAGAAASATAADIEAACGADGMLLIDQERAGTIDAVGQAALDALRAVCEAEGRPLPGPPADASPPPTIVETVTVTVPAVQQPAVAGGAGYHDDGEFEEYEEYEDEEDDDEHEEHEDDDHEEDD